MLEAVLFGANRRAGGVPGALSKVTYAAGAPQSYAGNSYGGIGLNDLGERTLYLGTGVPRRFNLDTLTWSAVAAQSFRGEACAAVVNNELIVVCGGNNLVTSYNFAANQWTTKTAYPGTMRYGGSACAANGKLYVSGGYWISSGTNFERTLRVFDPVANTWADLTNATQIGALTGRYIAALASPDGDTFYYGLGSTSPTFLTDFMKLQVGVQRQTLAMRSPAPGRATPTYYRDGKVFFFGPTDTGKQGINIYDVELNMWLEPVATETTIAANTGLLFFDGDKTFYIAGKEATGTNIELWQYVLQD